MRRLLTAVVLVLASVAFGCARPENAGDEANANRAGAANANSGGNYSDSWITTKAKLALLADNRTSGFATDITTQDRVVTLSGKVDTNEARAAAEEVVRKIEGVSSVNNQLQVVPESKREEVNARDERIDDEIEKALDSDPNLQDLSLSIDNNAGVVTVDGTVDTEDQLLKAAEALRKIPGVKSVVTTGVKITNEKKS
jgi:hyperosmotically inducible protein